MSERGMKLRLLNERKERKREESEREKRSDQSKWKHGNGQWQGKRDNNGAPWTHNSVEGYLS